MNHFLHRSCLITPVLLGLLAWSTLPGVSGVGNAANAAQPQKTTSTEVEPNWAVPSLQTLMKRYGCYVYSPKTRIDLAAALNTCLSIIGHHIAAKEDRAIAQALQKEFKPELSILRGDTKASEPWTVTLESQQFSSIPHPVGEVYGLQFSDVKPTDWAYQSLSLLVKRSGCLVGAPVYFQPDRAPTRDELAAGLNACLSRMGDRFATKEDRELAQALQTEFKPELAALKERVDRLQAQNATLKSQQFSTTTKIQGQVVITFQNGF
jgi:Carbohydrate-selective porin, OprB family